MKLPIHRWLPIVVPFSFATALVAASGPTGAEVKLTGIVGFTGVKQAILVVREPAASGQFSRTEDSVMLSEGQSSGSVEVLHIDQATGHVKIKNAGREMELSLAMDGIPAPRVASPPPAVLPAAVPVRRVPVAALPPPVEQPAEPEVVEDSSPGNRVVVIGRTPAARPQMPIAQQEARIPRMSPQRVPRLHEPSGVETIPAVLPPSYDQTLTPVPPELFQPQDPAQFQMITSSVPRLPAQTDPALLTPKMAPPLPPEMYQMPQMPPPRPIHWDTHTVSGDGISLPRSPR